MIYMAVISLLLVLVAYWFAKRAERLTLNDLSSAYRQIETALITGFLAYMALAGSLVLAYVTK